MSTNVSSGTDELLVTIVGRLTTALRGRAHNDPEYLAALSALLSSTDEELSTKLEELLVGAARREIAASAP